MNQEHGDSVVSGKRSVVASKSAQRRHKKGGMRGAHRLMKQTESSESNVHQELDGSISCKRG
jgi:hypothetical protein